MIDLYLINKLLTKNKEHANKDSEKKAIFTESSSQMIIGLILSAVALFFHFDCNKQMTLEVIAALCCPFCYILYHIVNKKRCKNIIDTTSESITNNTASAIQQGGGVNTSTISSIQFN